MKGILWIAALYNLSWGAFTIFFPSAIFSWAGMAQPTYPELWQCIGMIVGVYGLAYAAAAMDPFRHWPVIAAGLLGKVLGPMGLAKALIMHRFPPAFALTCLFNDFIWWAPFTLILYGAYRAHIHSQAVVSPEITRMALRARTQTGITLDQLSREAPLLLVFLRHAGCTFCREALSDIGQQRAAIEAKGGRAVLVHMGTEDQASHFLAKYGLSDILRVSDPERSLYRAFGLCRGGIREFLTPLVWWRGFKAAVFHGHWQGRVAGDGFQMPGAFVIFHGHIIRAFRHRTAADRPNYAALLGDTPLPVSFDPH
jgi:peroxiredoxin